MGRYREIGGEEQKIKCVGGERSDRLGTYKELDGRMDIWRAVDRWIDMHS